LNQKGRLRLFFHLFRGRKNLTYTPKISETPCNEKRNALRRKKEKRDKENPATHASKPKTLLRENRKNRNTLN